AATRAWNDPTASFRTESFALHIVTAWNALALADLRRQGVEWRKLEDDGAPVLVNGAEQSLPTSELVAAAFEGDVCAGLRRNVGFWISLRNHVAHRHLPVLDLAVIPQAQSALLNLETALVSRFGEEYGLAVALSVPLQLSDFRDLGVLGSLKKLQASLPLDLQLFLAHANSDESFNADPTYMLRVAFIPVVPPSGRGADSVAYFVRPDEVSDELAETISRYVVVPKVIYPPLPNLRPQPVTVEVGSRIPFKFNTQHHKRAAIQLKVRPPDGAANPEKTDGRYCRYESAFKSYLYNEAWIERLVEVLSTEDGFRRTTGAEPKWANLD
ncbi:MAG: hypothetical protein R2761_28470, partial [Acidimicrobiales bacterium]